MPTINEITEEINNRVAIRSRMREHCWVCHKVLEFQPNGRIQGHESCEGSIFSPCTILCGFATDPNNPANDPDWESNNSYGRSLVDELRRIEIPSNYFNDFAFSVNRGTPNQRRRALRVEKSKTMEEEFQEFVLKQMKTPVEEMELRLKYYVEDRDE